MQLAVIDYGSGNLKSVVQSVSHVVAEYQHPFHVFVTDDADKIRHADRVILPGVGHFADCRAGLNRLDGVVEALTEVVLEKARPFLGICVGMQLMASHGFEGAEEGTAPTAGLGWIDGEVKAIRQWAEGDSYPAASDTVSNSPHMGLKIPHMGWNNIAFQPQSHPVLNDLHAADQLYFVHSYAMRTAKTETCLATCSYGAEFAAIIGRDNMVGTQFHPEKSQKAGQKLIHGFLKWSV